MTTQVSSGIKLSMIFLEVQVALGHVDFFGTFNFNLGELFMTDISKARQVLN